jgi:transcriptional regulator with XRE-family HTH domain
VRGDKSPVAVQFGRNLRACRRRAKLSQERLSELAFLDRTEIGLLERGQRTPLIPTLLKLAEALAIDPGELLRGIDSQLPERTEMPARAPHRTDEEAHIEVGLLTVILDLHPKHLTAEQLVRRARPAHGRVEDEEGALERGLVRLQGVGLVRERDELIEPTPAALHFDRLPVLGPALSVPRPTCD